jgi:pyruvate/2-oxoglutarate dehydrogenase complex dihydrolipoamide dehydrogenase (E3) component/uncharacterized membrane protein YdjX (TVP38/TMEM64 family)
MNRRSLVLLAAVIVAAVLFFALDLDRFLTLEYVKGAQARVAALYAERPVAVIGGYFAVYVAVAALSLPGAAVLTLLAGAVFGLATGTVIVSFASSLGALLAMLVARHVLRGAVEARFARQSKDIDAGIARDGAFYLFTLRLIPAFPFFLVNLVMGLTRIRAWTFYWVSQLGMLAGTIVYVNAGTQLAKLESLAGIVSPAIVGSFVLLGLFPLVAKKVVDAVRAKKVYAKWADRKPKRFDRNLVVIGAGAAGLVTAYIGAAVKAKVTLVERHRMGGDCLNYGCVPSKALIKTATLAHQVRHAERYGLGRGSVEVDFAAAMERVQRVIAAIAPHDSVERYTSLGVDVVEGEAKIVDPWHVRIRRADGAEQVLSTRAIVVATGAEPFVPPLPGIEQSGFHTSDTLWNLRERPERLVVLGGGPIGCELAQCFARLGSQVVQVEMAPRLVPREDEEVSALVKEALEADGVEVLVGHPALRCEQDASGQRTLIVKAGGAERAVPFDALLCAVGRKARLTGFGLEELGLPAQRTIEVNEYLETPLPNILACGDVAGPYQFTHVAAHQAWYAAVNGLFGTFRRFKVDYSVIPWCTFTDPEVARVGLSESEAKAQNVPYEVTRYGIDDLDRAIADSSAHGFVKVLTVPGRDRILGATIVGTHAGDLLAEFVLAMKHGLGLNKLLGTIHTYPTLAEANKYAAGEWKRAHAPQGLLAWVQKFHAWRRG